MPNELSGIGDPYWYEWSVGLEYIIELLDLDSDVEAVTLQAEAKKKGLDDVQVFYKSRRRRLIQVKHTRSGEALTFGSLVATDSAGSSLLSQLAVAWDEADDDKADCDAFLYTNRVAATHESCARTGIQRPALSSFWPTLKDQLDKVGDISEIKIEPEYRDAWEVEWLGQLQSLPNDHRKLEFMRRLDIRTNQPDLTVIEERLLCALERILRVSRSKATDVLGRLCSALSTWTTSKRTKPRVEYEDVCKALQIPKDELSSDHYLVPPEPFFASRAVLCREIEESVTQRERPVCFLSGSPGCGKTSVISSLANRPNAPIHFRFHAFKPITPDTGSLPADAGRTITARALWGDLLHQLQMNLKGRHAKHRVPARSDFLEDMGLREEVLRLLSVIHQEIGAVVVVAIDGIDHAARAREGTETLLDSLPSPLEVPEGVCFLLAGQPHSDSQRYPIWLRDPEPDEVKRFEVPAVSRGDIENLYDSSKHAIPTQVRAAAIRIIEEYADGNTLAAVFANAEAGTSASAEELESRLEKRRLKNGLVQYYQQIWEPALAGQRHSYPTLDRWLAAVVALTREKITPELLKSIFSTISINDLGWIQLLRQLRPLLAEDEGGFRVLHNDVRVFLDKYARADRATLTDVASKMADHYRSKLADPRIRHISLMSLLDLAGRSVEQADVFTPDYVLEGASLYRPIQELVDDARVALHSIRQTPEPDWGRLHGVSLGLATLAQYLRCRQWLDREFDPSPMADPILPPVLMSERRVPPRESWTCADIHSLASDALHLIHEESDDRAQGLLKRWLGGLTAYDIAGYLEAGLAARVPHRRSSSSAFDEETESALRHLGEALERCGVNLQRPAAGSDEVRSSLAEASLASGRIDTLDGSSTPRSILRVRQRSGSFFYASWEPLLEACLLARNWVGCALVLRFTKPECASPRHRAAAWLSSQLLGDEALEHKWALAGEAWRDVLDGISDSPVGRTLMDSAILCAAYSSANPALVPSDAGTQVLEQYYSKPRDDRERAHCGRIFRAAALLGRYLHQYVGSGSAGLGEWIRDDEVGLVCYALLDPELSKPAFVPYEFDEVANVLLQSIEGVLRIVGGKALEAIRSHFRDYARKGLCRSTAYACWRGLAHGHELPLLREWAEKLIGANGLAWDFSFDDRTKVVERFVELAGTTGLTDISQSAEHRVAWGQLSYVGRKDYSLETPLKWYKEFAKHSARAWRDQGCLLLAISQEASDMGDNRAHFRVAEAVTSTAIRAGASDLWELLSATGSEQTRNWLPYSSDTIVEALISAVPNTVMSETDMLASWSFALGYCAPQVQRNRSILLRLATELMRSGEERGFSHLASDLEALAPETFAALESASRDGSEDRSHSSVTSSPNAPSDSISKVPELVVATDNSTVGKWRTINERLNVLRRNPPSGFSELLDRVSSELIAPPQKYTFSFDGREDLAVTLMSLLPDSKAWDVARIYVERLDMEDWDGWIGAAADNLDSFCLGVAARFGSSQLETGLNRILAMHVTCIEGAGRLKKLNRVQFVQEEDLPSDLQAVFLRILLDLVCFAEAVPAQAALQGIWLLCVSAPKLFGLLASQAVRLKEPQKYLLLLLAERAASAPDHFDSLRSFVEHCSESRNLEVSLQASVVLRLAARCKDQEAPPIGIGPPPDLTVPKALAHGLFQMDADRLGSLQLAGNHRAALNLIQHLRHVFGGFRFEDLEERVAASIRHDPPPAPDPRRRYERGDWLVSATQPARERCLDILNLDLHERGYDDVVIERVAQVVLPNDEPWLLFQPPFSKSPAELWPFDQELEEVLQGNRSALEKKLHSCLCYGLQVDECVLAGQVATYSVKSDCRYRFQHVCKRVPLIKKHPFPTTLGGRAFLLRCNGRFEPQLSEDLPFTLVPGGHGTFPHSAIDPYPAKFWHCALGWVPDSRNPLRFLREGVCVARFEWLTGPLRDTIRSPEFRQPQATRWVIKKAALEKAGNILNGAIVESRQLVAAPFSRPR